MEEDVMSTATMTSVTEGLSLDESDTSTNDVETSSQITSSDVLEQGNSTVIHTPLFQIHDQHVEADVIDVNMEGGSEQDEVVTTPEESNSVPQAPFIRPTGRPKASASNRPNRSQPSQGGIRFPDLLSTSGRWYEHECFNHYWRHYQFVSLWCQKHTETYRAVAEQYNKTIAQQMAKQQTQANNSQSQHVFKKPVSAKTIRNRRARRRSKAAKRRLRMAIKNAELAGSCSSLSSTSPDNQKMEAVSDSEATKSGKDEDMEITSEMLDFFAHTHKHRQERDALKKKKEGKEEKHVNIEEGDEQNNRTETAPVERPGSKRTSEMRLLYGKGAAMIHGMETALQMTFDRNVDVQQPSLWPNMPFRIVF